MIWLIATFISAIVFGIGSFLLKVGSHKNYPEASMLLGLYVAGSTIFLGILLTATSDITFSWLLLTFSILVGLGSYYGNSFLVKAYEMGPASLTSPLMNISILLVILLSALIYHEKISNLQYVGLACMVGAVSILGINFKNTLIKDRMWAVFVPLAIVFLFMREGGLKVAHENGLNNLAILFFGYLLASMLAITSLWKNDRGTMLQAMVGNKNPTHRPAIILGSLVGILSAIGMGLLAYAIARGPASVIVTIFSARNFITVLLIGIFFREKLSPLQWTSVGLLIIGIFFIS